MKKVEHTLKPIYDKNSKVLILGSMPSVASRANMKYYAHPSNRFWQILEILFEETSENWENFILKHHLALWDVIESCDIEGSSDSSIKDVKVNDIASILKQTQIKHIFVLGKTAYNLYEKYIYPDIKIKANYLPSPSSANATFSLERLVEEYRVIKSCSEKKL